jgi:Domain of unknown function (DUF4157)
MHESAHRHAEPTTAAASDDSDTAPGRASRAAQLTAPTVPVVSGLIQRKPRDSSGVADDADQAIASAAATSGTPLPASTMTKFESSLGADLSGVRIHTGAESQAAAHSVSALAYTVGQDIHFAAGQYDPASPQGEHLLAHEVAHTVQQAGGAPTRQHKLALSAPADHSEREADRAADAMVAGAPFALGASPAIAARKEDDKQLSIDKSVKTDKIGGSFSIGWKPPKAHIPQLKAELSSSVTAKGDITLEPASNDDKAPKPHAAQVKEAGSFFSKQLYESDHKPDAVVESIEIGAELDKEAKPGKGKVGLGLAFGATLKLRNGVTVKGTGTILKVGKTPNEPLEVSTLTFEAEETAPLYTIPKDTIWNEFKVNGGINLSFKFEIKPDKAALAAEALKRFAPKLFGEIGEVATSASEVLMSTPALVAIAGLYITVKTTMASLKEIDDITGAAAAAEQAAQGYAGGFSASVGGRKVAGDPAWHAQGVADGTRMLNEQVAKLQVDPRFQKYNFSVDELRNALLDRVREDPDSIYGAVYAGSRVRIKEAYVKAWQDHLTFFDKIFTDTHYDERVLRTRMGLKDTPSGQPAADMPEGASTGLTPEED